MYENGQEAVTVLDNEDIDLIVSDVMMPVMDGIDSLDELFQETYKHEQLITQKINELAHAAMTNQDYPTFNFLQWYVSEQHEEEKLFKSIIDKLSLAGKSGEGLYFIDKELSTLDTQN